MSDGQLYFFIAVVISVLFLFVFGMLYVNKKLRENKSIGKVILVPILISLFLAIALFIIAFSQV